MAEAAGCKQPERLRWRPGSAKGHASMSSFDPTPLLARRSTASDEGPIAIMSQRARDLRAQGRDIVAMTIGEPDFDTPEHIRRAAGEAMERGFTHYSPVPGIPELRAALAKKLMDENGLAYAASDIVLANGAKQAIANAMLALLEPGDEVILLAPYWVSYEITAGLCGAKCIFLKADVSEDFKVAAACIASALTERSKLLVINSPNNPTGAVWSKGELEEIAAVVRAHPRLMVLSDEIYEYISFDGAVTSIGALPGMLERTITVNGFSKGFAMTGWRLGYAAAPAPIARAMSRMQSAISAGANQFVQRAALVALSGSRQPCVAMRESYRHRRDLMMAGLARIPGLRLAPIPATFYAFPNVAAFLGRKANSVSIDTVEILCDWLLETQGLAIVPGTAFGDPHCVRLSFAVSEADIGKGLERLGAGLAILR
jgi:aspartate aminotransferase